MQYDALNGTVYVHIGNGKQSFPVDGRRLPPTLAGIGKYVADLLAPHIDVDPEASPVLVSGEIVLHAGGAKKVLEFSSLPIANGKVLQAIADHLGAVAAGTTVELMRKREADKKAEPAKPAPAAAPPEAAQPSEQEAKTKAKK